MTSYVTVPVTWLTLTFHFYDAKSSPICQLSILDKINFQSKPISSFFIQRDVFVILHVIFHHADFQIGITVRDGYSQSL